MCVRECVWLGGACEETAPRIGVLHTLTFFSLRVGALDPSLKAPKNILVVARGCAQGLWLGARTLNTCCMAWINE